MPSKGKKKKIITKKIVFRLSLRQKRLLDRYCKAHNLSVNKLLKTAIKDYMLLHFDLPDEEIISKNQLNIFDIIDEEDNLENEVAEDIPDDDGMLRLF
jgi:hypothetical protein